MQKALTFSRTYINFSTISHQKGYKNRNYNFQNIKKKELFSASLIGIFVFSIIIFYIFQINLTIQSNYQLRDFENKILNLQNENQKLKIEALSLETSQILADEAEYLGMEANNKIQYVKIFTPTFVKK